MILSCSSVLSFRLFSSHLVFLHLFSHLFSFHLAYLLSLLDVSHLFFFSSTPFYSSLRFYSFLSRRFLSPHVKFSSRLFSSRLFSFPQVSSRLFRPPCPLKIICTLKLTGFLSLPSRPQHRVRGSIWLSHFCSLCMLCARMTATFYLYFTVGDSTARLTLTSLCYFFFPTQEVVFAQEFLMALQMRRITMHCSYVLLM